MTRDEQPREKRFACDGKADLFLTDKNYQTAMTERLHGQLLDISAKGASLALAEIITDRKHMAYTPMESDLFKLNLVLYITDEELVLPVKTIWFNKKISGEELPFRIGMEFLKPLSSEQLKKIRTP